MSNVKEIELPNWDKKLSQLDCIVEHQEKINQISRNHFKKLWKNNLRLWLAVGLLICIIGFQQYQIHQISKEDKKIVIVDNQTDLTGLDLPPVEGLR